MFTLGFAADAIVMDEVLVTSKRPGPELWRVYKQMPDGQTHELWILGSITPLPRKMRWESGVVEEKIRTADAVLMPPSMAVEFKVGILSGLMLLPKAISTRKNPDNQTLQEIIAPEVYSRWLVAKQQYMGRSRSVERKRPLIASNQLFERALRKSGLEEKDLVLRLVRKSAKRFKRTVENPVVRYEITDTKALVNELKTTPFQDEACFDQTLHFVESDLQTAKHRAKAWADGDLLALQLLPLTEFRAACRQALASSDVLKKRGITDVENKLSTQWLLAAEKMLEQHKSTFALLPMRAVMEKNGLVQQLVARGYRLELPKELRKAQPPAEKVDALSAVVLQPEAD
jgi:hypothetical protein